MLNFNMDTEKNIYFSLEFSPLFFFLCVCFVFNILDFVVSKFACWFFFFFLLSFCCLLILANGVVLLFFESVFLSFRCLFREKTRRQKQIKPVFSCCHAKRGCGVDPAGWSSNVLIHCTVKSHRYAFSNILTFMITNTLYIFIAINKSNEISYIWRVPLCSVLNGVTCRSAQSTTVRIIWRK